MIAATSKPCVIKQRSEVVGSYGQPSSSFTTVKTVDMSITLVNQVSAPENIKFYEASHLGLTFDKSLAVGMRVEQNNKVYEIKLVNNFTRYTQLFLKEL